MEQLLNKLGINPNQSNENILEELGKKQMEYLDRLDNVEDEKRREELSAELKEIEGAVSAVSWFTKQTSTGIKRDSVSEVEETENFVKLKIREVEKSVETIHVEQEASKQEKTDEELLAEACAAMEKDIENGIEMMRQLAEKGFSKAQERLGYMYEYGKGVVQNDGVAIEWYQKAANQGNAKAQSSLGHMYEIGKGVIQNDEMAVEWYRKAAEQGHYGAQLFLATSYEIGKGVVQNDEMAVEWYQKAAEQAQDDSYAQKRIEEIKRKKEKSRAGLGQLFGKLFKSRD